MAFERTSGKVAWTRVVHQGLPRVKRHVKASHASATPATDGKVLVAMLGEDGQVFVVRAGRTFELLATNDMTQACMATPALSGDLLVIRTTTHLYGLRGSN